MNYLMKLWLKIIFLCTMLSATISLGAPKKNAILPQARPDTSYNVTPIRLIRSDDSNLGIATYRIRSFNLGSQVGWAITTEEITVTWKNGQYQGYQVGPSTQTGGYDLAMVEQTAKNWNIPFDVLESSIIAHEKQHMEDLKKYKSLNFIGFEDTSVDNQALQQRHNEIAVLLEARAVSAQINAFYKEIKSTKAKLGTITNQLNNHNKNSSKKVTGKKYDAGKLLNHDQYVALQDESKKLSGYLDALFKKNKRGQYILTKEAIEEFVLKLHGDAIISGTSVKYADAYKKYVKDASNKEKATNNSFFAKFITLRNEIVDNYLRIYTEKVLIPTIKTGKHTFSQELTLPKNRRPVCRPCMLGDTMGKCKYAWCPNYNNQPSKYKQQPGDYIPINYETLEAPSSK